MYFIHGMTDSKVLNIEDLCKSCHEYLLNFLMSNVQYRTLNVQYSIT